MQNLSVALPLLISVACWSAEAQHDLKLTPYPLPFRMTDDGRNCSGYLLMTKDHFIWNSSWVIYQAKVWDSAYKDGKWIITLDQPVAIRNRGRRGVPYPPITVVEVESEDATMGKDFKAVTGYLSRKQMQDPNSLGELSCEMQLDRLPYKRESSRPLMPTRLPGIQATTMETNSTRSR